MRLQQVVRQLTTAALTLGFCLNSFGQESKYKVTTLDEGPPKGLAASVVETLQKKGYRVSDPSGKTICNAWLRTELPVLPDFQDQLDLKYPLKPGTLVGAIQFSSGGSDFRQQKIKPGVYTLRYGHQPQDGNHLGTADYRDFLVICHPTSDKSPEDLAEDPLVDLSTKVSGNAHPVILSLMPPQVGRAKIPTMVRDDIFELDILVAKTSTNAGKEIQIELVMVGHSDE